MMSHSENTKKSGADSRWFYRDIVAVDSFEAATGGLGQTELPSDWWIVVADVAGSTKAIEDGRYKDVNTTGAATIMAVINVDRKVPIPYIFGGDGATLAVPSCMAHQVRCALLGAQAMARQAFNMELRVGLIPVLHLQKMGVSTAVGKFRRNDSVNQASFSGAGWATAENIIKNGEGLSRFDVYADEETRADADFTGFECRWQPVAARKDHKLAILVQALDEASSLKSAVYNDFLKAVQEIYGDVQDLHPLFAEGLALSANPRKFWGEVCVRSQNRGIFTKIWYAFVVSFISIFSFIAFPLRLKIGSFSWGEYRNEVVKNTDFRKFDGVLKMVVDGTDSQRDRLKNWLEEQENQGRLTFGLHQSAAAIVTCLIFSHGSDHTHFVDGSDGGYAMAAKQLKLRLAQIKLQKAGGAA